MPIIDYVVRNKFLLFFVLSLVLSSFITFPKILSLDIFFWYLPFFIFGCYLVSKRESYIPFLKRFGFFSVLLFLVWGGLEYMNLIDIPKNVISFISIISIGYISSIKIVRNSFLEYIGDNSFYIYLFNTMIMGAISVLFINWLGKDYFLDKFYYFAPILLLAGSFFPILLHKYVISKIPILNSFIK